VLSLQVVYAVLLVGKSATALGAHEGVLLAALVLEVSVQVVVPVVRSLTMGTDKDSLGSVGISFVVLLPLTLLLYRLSLSVFVHY